MQLGMVGLGKMGGNRAVRLLRGGHNLVVYDRSADASKPSAKEGAIVAKDVCITMMTRIKVLLHQFRKPRLEGDLIAYRERIADEFACLVAVGARAFPGQREE